MGLAATGDTRPTAMRCARVRFFIGRAGACTAAATFLLGASPCSQRMTDLVGAAMALDTPVQVRPQAPVGPVRSFRMTFTTAQKDNLVGIFDEDKDRQKFTLRHGSSTSDIYFAGKLWYQRDDHGSWTRFDIAALSSGVAPSRQVANVESHNGPTVNLPDRRVNGVAIGVVRTQISAGMFERGAAKTKTVPFTCTYEKATGRARSCTVGNLASVKFDRYNDPSNAFTIPAAALNAPLFKATR